MLTKLSVNQTLIKAKSHVKRGKVTEAQKLYEEILQKFPKNIQAQQALDALNKFNQNNAKQNPPQDAVNQLINLYNKGQLSDVVEQAQGFTKLYPEIFIIWNILGIAAAQKGMLDIAIEAFNKSISLKPDYAETYNNKGNVLKSQVKIEEAIDSYKKALSLNPDYAEAFSNMGNALQEQGKLDEAIVSYEKAIALKLDNPEAHNNIGNVLVEQG